ncbi:glycosyltransferase family 4 protein [Pseudomonas nitroreducens]|uniref:glycosyltransferase family 4 protein n=1 Tax=Pseudomonas nitroreducens TaxID=46680 RepID=UPI00209DED86|nr:glycosyltransferase family 4 protein [Pseudomonas nitroreducens]MCP1624162.1 glycosyltransferase involved in cell wall biosynthesis [Pseudomonas nitroreducens]
MTPALVLRKSINALNFARRNGWGSMLRLAHRKISEQSGLFGRTDIFDQYAFLSPAPIGNKIAADAVGHKTINWFIPRVGKGSGGHLNIFRFIKNLEDQGFECRIIIVDNPLPKSAVVAKQDIHRWFFPLKAEVFVGTDGLPPAYFSFATSWQTAYTVRAFQATVTRCYFVQDFEPWFFPAGSEALMAEATYHFGFQGFTAGSWLAEKLRAEYAMQTCALGFSFDKDLYRPGPKPDDSTRRVFFYARPPTARRAFELGMLVLREVCRQRSDITVVLAGWDVSQYEIPFPCEHLGLVEIEDLPGVYQRCDVALVLSCTNLSLLPLELMASGVPVVSNDAPHTRWLLNDENSALATATVEDLTTKLIQVLDDPSYAERLRNNGLHCSGKTSWEKEAMKMVQRLERLAANADPFTD